MTGLPRNIFRLLRPRQWIKNFAIFAAVLFSGKLFDIGTLQQLFLGFLVFCAISSAIYVINDIFDAKKDRLHPFKRFRPIAKNDVSVKLAILIVILLASCSLTASYFISPGFFAITFIYFILHFSYSMFLKHIEIVDILTLAAGYILRVYAGEVISNSHISAWLVLTTISLSLFLAIGKRRSELTLLSQQTKPLITTTRKTLSHYTEKLLDVYLSIFATSTFISYALFTFLVNPTGAYSSALLPDGFLGASLQKKWLMLTIIPVVYGLMRYLQRIYENHEGESPERVLFSDRPLLTSVVIWVLLTVGLIYIVG